MRYLGSYGLPVVAPTPNRAPDSLRRRHKARRPDRRGKRPDRHFRPPRQSIEQWPSRWLRHRQRRRGPRGLRGETRCVAASTFGPAFRVASAKGANQGPWRIQIHFRDPAYSDGVLGSPVRAMVRQGNYARRRHIALCGRSGAGAARTTLVQVVMMSMLVHCQSAPSAASTNGFGYVKPNESNAAAEANATMIKIKANSLRVRNL
jgi:hypothetical protein